MNYIIKLGDGSIVVDSDGNNPFDRCGQVVQHTVQECAEWTTRKLTTEHVGAVISNGGCGFVHSRYGWICNRFGQHGTNVAIRGTWHTDSHAGHSWANDTVNTLDVVDDSTDPEHVLAGDDLLVAALTVAVDALDELVDKARMGRKFQNHAISVAKLCRQALEVTQNSSTGSAV